MKMDGDDRHTRFKLISIADVSLTTLLKDITKNEMGFEHEGALSKIAMENVIVKGGH
jgi:hypothetical protein